MKDTRILVVDSLEESERLTPFINKSGHYLCGVAESGEDAVKLIGDTKPDLLFIGMTLKEQMNSTGLECRINENKIPFVFLTEDADAHIIGDIKGASPNAFLMRPFREEEVRLAVKIAMQKKS
jgi:CheY-like chemotaxis protein